MAMAYAVVAAVVWHTLDLHNASQGARIEG